MGKLEQLKSYQGRKNLTQKLQRGPMTWKDMLNNALSDAVTWQTRRRSNLTQFLMFVWTITKSKRKNWKKGELSEVHSQIVL